MLLVLHAPALDYVVRRGHLLLLLLLLLSTALRVVALHGHSRWVAYSLIRSKAFIASIRHGRHVQFLLKRSFLRGEIIVIVMVAKNLWRSLRNGLRLKLAASHGTCVTAHHS